MQPAHWELLDKCVNAFAETYLHNFSLEFLVYPTSILPEFFVFLEVFIFKTSLYLLPFCLFLLLGSITCLLLV